MTTTHGSQLVYLVLQEKHTRSKRETNVSVKEGIMADTARQHLNWAVDRALEYFDAGDKKNAIASFVSDVGKHRDTKWIQGHPLTLMTLEAGYHGGREEFKKAMSGFNV